MGWWKRLGLRGRLMLVGAGGIVVGLTIGSVAIVAATSYAMRRTVDRTAQDTADAIVAMIVEDGQLPTPLPVPTGQVTWRRAAAGLQQALSEGAALERC